MNSFKVKHNARETAFGDSLSSESLLDSSTLFSDESFLDSSSDSSSDDSEIESLSSTSTLSYYSSRSRSASSDSEAEYESASCSSSSEISQSDESVGVVVPVVKVPLVREKARWKYDVRSFWSDEPDDRSLAQLTIEEEDVPKVPLSKLLSTGEVLKHPISFRDLLALANHASRNVLKGHKFQRDDLISVTEHVGALSIQSVFTVVVKYQQYIIGLQRQRPEQLLKTYERPALPPGFDSFHARSNLDRNVNRFPFFDRCVDWYCVPLHVYQRIVKETLIQMYDKAQLLKERRKVEKQKEKHDRKAARNSNLVPLPVLSPSNAIDLEALGADEVERTHFRRPRAKNQVLNDESPAKKMIFNEYWTNDVVQRGLKNKELFEGILRINSRNYEQSYVSNPLGDTFPDIAILGMADRNRALNGDVVVCRIKDRSLWIVKQEPYEQWCEEQKQSTSKAEPIVLGNNKENKEEFLEFMSSYSPTSECYQELDKRVVAEDKTYGRNELLRCLAQIELSRRCSADNERVDCANLRGIKQGVKEASELDWYFKQGFKSFDRDIFEKLVDISVYKQLGSPANPILADDEDDAVKEQPTTPAKRHRKQSNHANEITTSSDGEKKTSKTSKKNGKKKRAIPEVSSTTEAEPADDVKQQLKQIIRRNVTREENRRKKDGERYLDCVHPQVMKEKDTQSAHKKVNSVSQCKRPVLKNTFTQKFVEDLPMSQRGLPDYCLQKTATIVAISEKKHTRLAVGSLKPFPGQNNKYILFSPHDSRIPRVVCDSVSVWDFYQNPKEYDGKIFLCQIDQWYPNAQFAKGTLVKCLGKAGDIETETEGILMKLCIDTLEYPDEFTDEVLPVGQYSEDVVSVSEEERNKRHDFTQDCVFTIDPKTARDLDDALHVKKLPNGNWEVGVHIADVSHFVKEGTKIDSWAQERTTSVYMVQKVIPMLPRMLCEKLCSLQPGVERLTFSVVWKMDKNFKILPKSTKFCRSIIKSCVKLSYEHAQDIIDKNEYNLPEIFGNHTADDVANSVLMLYEISKVLKQNRLKNGALRLDGPKMRFNLGENDSPDGVAIYERKDANFLVEEFMLLANTEVATKIYKAYPKIAFLRRHEPPKAMVLEGIVNACKSIGIKIDASSSGSICSSLRKYEKKTQTKNTVAQLLVHLLMKPMQLAKYFCTGSLGNQDNYRHYALSVPLYTHFTSPIRRYPDVIVHRLLAAAIDPKSCAPPSQSPTELSQIAKRCNEKKYDAKMASEESDSLFFNVLLRKKGKIETLGIVVDVNQVSVEVLCVKYGIIERIAFKNIPRSRCNPHSSSEYPSVDIVWEDPAFGAIKLTMLSVVKIVLKPNPTHHINRVATMDPISAEGLETLRTQLENTDLSELL